MAEPQHGTSREGPASSRACAGRRAGRQQHRQGSGLCVGALTGRRRRPRACCEATQASLCPQRGRLTRDRAPARCRRLETGSGTRGDAKGAAARRPATQAPPVGGDMLEELCRSCQCSGSLLPCQFCPPARQKRTQSSPVRRCSAVHARKSCLTAAPRACLRPEPTGHGGVGRALHC